MKIGYNIFITNTNYKNNKSFYKFILNILNYII